MLSFRQFFLVPAFLAAAALGLSACADMPKSPEQRAEAKAVNDPLEPVNRVIFDVNDFLDRLLIRPLAELYRNEVPPPLRDRLAGILSNMREPVILMNNLLQGNTDRAGVTVERFGINTVVGVGGMFEVANEWGLYQQQGDFGETLNSWGISEGPYLVLPLFGPSNFRDAIGLGVDSVASPWQYLVALRGNTAQNIYLITSFTADGVVRREQNIESLDALRSGSLDFYAQMRSVYRQYRNKQLGIQNTGETPKFEDYE
jgi:phospholipid-binding lipoprotein MlaA